MVVRLPEGHGGGVGADWQRELNSCRLELEPATVHTKPTRMSCSLQKYQRPLPQQVPTHNLVHIDLKDKA